MFFIFLSQLSFFGYDDFFFLMGIYSVRDSKSSARENSKNKRSTYKLTTEKKNGKEEVL